MFGFFLRRSASVLEVEENLSPLQKIADWIAWFSGSMPFLLINGIWFAAWIIVNVFPLGIPAFDPYPFGLLTMIVSLEAIFLSTFVMISQNRADAKREVLANQQWATVQDEDAQNDELLRLSRQILELTQQLHHSAHAPSNGDESAAVAAPVDAKT